MVNYVKQISEDTANTDNLSPMQNEISQLQHLIGQGANPKYQDDSPGEKGNTVLHYAARSGNKSLVDFLVDKCEVNAKNYRGVTPLLEAVSSGAQEKVLRSLIQAKADVNAENRRG